METLENGASVISDGTGRMPALKPGRVPVVPNIGGRQIDVLVLTRDDEFLATIQDSSRGLHDVHHANTPAQADKIARGHKVGVLVTDAAMVASNVEILIERLRTAIPRLVAVVAGRRDDGELLMDLINRRHVYRFLLKPVSPGRARLAIEASVKHHLEAADSAFRVRSKSAVKVAPSKPTPAAKPKAEAQAKPKAKAPPKAQTQPKPKAKAQPKPKAQPRPKVQTQPKPKAQTQPKPKARTQPKPQPQPQPQAIPQPKAMPRPVSENFCYAHSV
jgi:DNA-binding NarL/FixJ family response regulator